MLTMNEGKTPKFIWCDGEMLPWQDATTHVSELQWSGVGSVFEGLRSYFRKESSTSYIFGLDPHLKRLALSMRMVGMERTPPGIDIDALRRAALDVIQKNAVRGDEYIRIFVWFQEGWNYTTKQRLHAFVMSRPFTSLLGRDDVTWSAGVSTWRRLDDTSFPLRAKAVANYQNSRIAGIEAERRGFDFPILLNARGEVAEGPRECVFLVKDSTLLTPALHTGVLDSITRRTVIRLAEQLSVPVIERPILRTELFEADEIFAAATASEITPVTSIEGIPLGPTGPITQRIRSLYRDVVYGDTPLLEEMRTAVKIGVDS